jgi:amidase
VATIADAVTQAGLVAAGECTAGDMLQQAVSRIEDVNPGLGAVIHPLFGKAAAAVAAGLPDGPLRGVPMLVKDALCHTAGDPYHLGMRLLRERRWTEPRDTELARRFRRAGLVIVGRTNTPELATAFTTESAAYGPTRNPWDPARSADGSSGGSAAAVAAGMVAVAHGNDMGGSIRVPASQCGVVGLKPTRARISLAPDFGEYWGMLAHEGVLTRTVRDTAAVLDAVHGAAPGDPYTAPPPRRPFGRDLGIDPPPLRVGLRTAVPVTGAQPDPECAAAVQAAGALLERCGHHVEPAAIPALDDEAMGAHFARLFTASVARDLDRWQRRLGTVIGPQHIEPRNWMLAELGRQVTAAAYIAAVEYLQAYARRVARWWADGSDVLVTPTIRIPPPPLGWLPREPDLAAVADLGQFTCPFNVTGQPAVSLPLQWTAHGLPVGVQLVGGYGREDLLLQLAAQLERAAGWAHRYPAPGRPQPA